MARAPFDHRSEEESEAARHDRLYADTAARSSLVLGPPDWNRFDEEPRPWHPYESFVLMLGDVRGKRILDAGCGNGWLSVILAKRGAQIEGFDISPAAIRIAQDRALANGVEGQCTFRTASAYDLPYSDSTFDAVIGSALLHHLGDKERFASVMNRVLKHDGVAVFQEPFGNCLALERLRTLVPIPSAAADDPDQWKQQFKYKDLEPFNSLFEITTREYHLLSRLDRVISWPPFQRILGKLDHFLLGLFPFLRPYARIILLRLRPRTTRK